MTKADVTKPDSRFVTAVRRYRQPYKEVILNLYILTSSGWDSHRAEVVIITCQACGYYEEHCTDRGLGKVGKACDRCSR